MEFDLEDWIKKDRKPFQDSGLLELGRRAGFHKACAVILEEWNKTIGHVSYENAPVQFTYKELNNEFKQIIERVRG